MTKVAGRRAHRPEKERCLTEFITKQESDTGVRSDDVTPRIHLCMDTLYSISTLSTCSDTLAPSLSCPLSHKRPHAANTQHGEHAHGGEPHSRGPPFPHADSKARRENTRARARHSRGLDSVLPVVAAQTSPHRVTSRKHKHTQPRSKIYSLIHHGTA